MTSPFDATLEERGGTLCVALRGELDISTAPRFEEALRRVEADGPAVALIDLSELEFMDSTGLTMLTRWSRGADRDGYNLALVPGDDRVHRLFEITGMVSFFTFVDG